MNAPDQSQSPFAPLLAAQLDALFANGLVVSFTYHHVEVGAIPLLGVVDQFPARLSGVNPGDLRVRVRTEDLTSVPWAGPPDWMSDDSGMVCDVISSAVEFGGAGIALQCRRRASAAVASAQAQTSFALMPCVSRSGRDAMTNVAAGTAVFQTDDTPGLRVFNGTNWVRFTETID